MTFDQSWEELFQRRQWGVYPSEQLVRFMARSFPDRSKRGLVKVLDLGCGGGANTWFLDREGFRAHGIDGSPTAIRQAEATLRAWDCKADLKTGDIARLPYADGEFDAVLDIAAVQHNRWSDIERISREIHRVLKPGGLIFAIVLNHDTSGWETATKLEDNTYTKLNLLGAVSDFTFHLFTEDELRGLLRDYRDVAIERATRTEGGQRHRIGHFIVQGRKA